MRGVHSAVAALILSLLVQPAEAEEAFAATALAKAPEEAESAAAGPPAPRSYGVFVLPERMIPRVKFWVNIYARYSSWEYSIHDTKYPQLVYSVIDTRDKPRGAMNAEKVRVSKVLKGLVHKAKLLQEGKLGREKLSAAENAMLKVFEDNGLLSELPEAASLKRIRGQAGLKDNLEDAIFVSGRYLPRMEKVFERFNLPTEIAYLPFVESGFNKKAISKVGASGIWQFMPYTGKLYLRVDEEVDERNDPMRAAEAAARLMQQNYNLLAEWPLAITAYNHGAAGIARAARESGSKELPDIIERYEGKGSFGFASQNFYASFLAALHVAKNSEAFLGNVPRAKKLEFDEFVMPHYMDVRSFVEKLGIEEATFRELNPALTAEVYAGRKYIPVGYTVRIPTEIREDFFARYEAIPGYLKHGEQKATETPVAAQAPANAVASPEAAGLVIK
jgi:membrane-bound lytic murein transglycosylase D